MEIVIKKINEIKPYERNPRKNDEAVQYVANSIQEFGFKVPIVIDKKGIIIAGHTRYKAAIELNMNEVPCIIASDLNEEQVKAFRLADNKVGEVARWDANLLGEELDNIFDIDMELFNFNFELPSNMFEEEPKNNEDIEIPNKYEIIFNSQEEMDIWVKFIVFLKQNVDGETISEKIVNYLQENVL